MQHHWTGSRNVRISVIIIIFFFGRLVPGGKRDRTTTNAVEPFSSLSLCLCLSLFISLYQTRFLVSFLNIVKLINLLVLG